MAGKRKLKVPLVELPLVTEWNQVAANIRTLEAARRSEDAQLRKKYESLIEKGTCFVKYQSDLGIAFAPSRFIGYVGNDLEIRVKGRQGGTTNRALARKETLGRDSELDESAEGEYRRFCIVLGFEPNETAPFNHPRKYWVTDKVVLNSAAQEISLPDWTPPPEVASITTRKVRDTKATKRLKGLYEYECMVCGTRIGLSGGKGYAEGAHIRPIGGPNPGPDEPENILVLCPNHHVMLDAGLLGIDPDTLEVRLAQGAEPADYEGSRLQLRGGHTLRREHLEYHLKEIFNRQ